MTSSTRKQRTKPQISVNQFGQYLEAKGSRRNKILKDQKFPNEVMILYYKEAFDAIVEFIANGYDGDKLVERFEEIGEKPTSTVQQNARLESCMDAIETFSQLFDNDLESSLSDMKIIRAPHNPSDGLLRIAGVDISLRPDFFLQRTDKQKNKHKGLIKFYISKHNMLTDYVGKAIATLCFNYLENLSSPEGKPDKKLVFVVDVFGKKVFQTPGGTKILMDDIETSCREIERIWPSITEND